MEDQNKQSTFSLWKVQLAYFATEKYVSSRPHCDDSYARAQIKR